MKRKTKQKILDSILAILAIIIVLGLGVLAEIELFKDYDTSSGNVSFLMCVIAVTIAVFILGMIMRMFSKPKKGVRY